MGMNPEIKAQWIRDLTSGEYDQGTDKLANKWGHCCLGVLCEQAVKAGVLEKRQFYSGGTDEDEWFYGTAEDFENGEEDCTLPPLSVFRWAGLATTYTDSDGKEHPLPTYDPRVRWDGAEITLSQLNDMYGRDFDDIAEVIENQL